jgi:hypothetical protein
MSSFDALPTSGVMHDNSTGNFEIPALVRSLVNDLDSTNYKYSDDDTSTHTSTYTSTHTALPTPTFTHCCTYPYTHTPTSDLTDSSTYIYVYTSNNYLKI